jgi:dephospho-CoA kinase
MADYLEIPLTPQGTALVDRVDAGRVSEYQWRLDISHGYVYTSTKREDGSHEKIYLHRFIMNPPKGLVVDHRNRVKTDNRRSNLQVVTQQVNAMYQKRKPHKASGYIGVRPSNKGSKWRSSIMTGRREISIGRFNNRHDAALAYNEKATELLGDRADLNVIRVPKIALTGMARSGKSVVADYISQKYGFSRYAFGDELKRFAHLVFDEVDESSKPRRLYQFFGQMCREYDSEIWIRKLFEKIQKDNPEDILIEDLRQPNEFERCRSEGYVIIRVTAPEALRIDRAIKSGDTFNLRDLTHDTESHARSFVVDYEIVNDGTLAELYAKVDAIIAEVSAQP